MQKQMETAMQSANMKKHLEKVVGDTISSPLMQTKWQELILKAGEVKPVDGGGGSGGGGRVAEQVVVAVAVAVAVVGKAEKANSPLRFSLDYFFVFFTMFFAMSV